MSSANGIRITEFSALLLRMTQRLLIINIERHAAVGNVHSSGPCGGRRSKDPEDHGGTL
jgi:hypothetical protein